VCGVFGEVMWGAVVCAVCEMRAHAHNE